MAVDEHTFTASRDEPHAGPPEGRRSLARLVLERGRERGAAWTALAGGRRAARLMERWTYATARRAERLSTGLATQIESRMAGIERRRHLVGYGTVSSEYQSYELNKTVWAGWDWSLGGEEWTLDALTLRGKDPRKWKDSIVELLKAHVPEGGAVLEVGPGAGRWTTFLVTRAHRVVLADIVQSTLDICRGRFGEQVECFVVDERPVLDLPARSLDAVWTYDVFVHVNPPAADAWIGEISRLLKPGGHAVIHHGGGNSVGVSYELIGRSNLDAQYVTFLAEKHGLEVLHQDTTLPQVPGDVITICRAPMRS